MSSLNPGAASFNVNSQTLQFQMTLDSTSNPVVAGDVVTLLTDGNVRRADNGPVLPSIYDSSAALSGPNDSAAPLTSTTFVVCYRGASGYLYGVIGTVNGNSITYSTPLALNAVASSGVSVSALSATAFVVSYADNNSYPNALVCTVSGTVITAGSPTVINSVSNSGVESAVAALSSTSFVVAYSGASQYLNAVVCTVSGTVITEGTPVALNAATSSAITVCALSSTSFVATYYNSSARGNAVVCTVVGTVITSGSPTQFSANSGAGAIAALDSTHVVIMYGQSAIIGTVSGTTIAFGSAVTSIVGANLTSISVCALTSTSFMVMSRTSNISSSLSGGSVNCNVCTVSGGNVITAGTSAVVSNESWPLPAGSGAVLYSSLIFMSSGVVVAEYINTEGRAIVVPYSGSTITYPSLVPTNTIGVAASSATPGNNLNVVSIGVTATNISYTLTIGNLYYWDASIGRPSANNVFAYSLGVALNTQLLLVARVTGNNQFFG